MWLSKALIFRYDWQIQFSVSFLKCHSLGLLWNEDSWKIQIYIAHDSLLNRVEVYWIICIKVSHISFIILYSFHLICIYFHKHDNMLLIKSNVSNFTVLRSQPDFIKKSRLYFDMFNIWITINACIMFNCNCNCNWNCDAYCYSIVIPPVRYARHFESSILLTLLHHFVDLNTWVTEYLNILLIPIIHEPNQMEDHPRQMVIYQKGANRWTSIDLTVANVPDICWTLSQYEVLSVQRPMFFLCRSLFFLISVFWGETLCTNMHMMVFATR